MQYSIPFGTGEAHYYFGTSFEAIGNIVLKEQTIIITDEHVNTLHGHLFKGFKAVIAIPAGETGKNIEGIQSIVNQLIATECHRKTFLLGVGGGIVTDITGFVASIYMRGLRVGFVPTTVLGMVDAAIGGKNGVNFGLQKNLLGTIQQPQFLLFDTTFLKTLPDAEWQNGFAEVIKYGCLFDTSLFEQLEQLDIVTCKSNNTILDQLMQRCIGWKNKIVLQDEHEDGARKLLNFGHTAGHAIETLYGLPHGYAVGLGMIVACILSEKITGMDASVTKRLIALLERYGLPVSHTIEPDKLMQILKLDKKRNAAQIDFILLNNIGDGIVYPLSTGMIQQALEIFSNAGHH